MIFDESELGADAMPSPLTAAVVRPQERAFDVTYDIGGNCGEAVVYAMSSFDAIERLFCNVPDSARMLNATITVKERQ